MWYNLLSVFVSAIFKAAILFLYVILFQLYAVVSFNFHLLSVVAVVVAYCSVAVLLQTINWMRKN